MENHPIVLFGEAEKGEFQSAYFCYNLPQLEEYFGNPPADTLGLFFAVQALLYKREVVFFRVQEEGFSSQDYLSGLNLIQSQKIIPIISAIGIPGVGSTEIIDATTEVCTYFHTVLITTEADLYDYLSAAKS